MEQKLKDSKNPKFYKVSLHDQIDFRIIQNFDYELWEKKLKEDIKSNQWSKNDKNMRNRVITTHLGKDGKVVQQKSTMTKTKTFYKAFMLDYVSKQKL